MIKSRDELNALRDKNKKLLDARKMSILVCAETGCIAAGALQVADQLKAAAEAKGIKLEVALSEDPHTSGIALKGSGCHGFCEMAPLIRIEPQGLLYLKVQPEDCADIIEQTVLNGKIVDRLCYAEDGKIYPKMKDVPFYSKQTLTLLGHASLLDTEDIDDFIGQDGFQATAKALFDLQPSEIVDMVLQSSLRGRGGGGFVTGRKWMQVARQKGPIKYVVCNADEGDPGAFMDRSILEGDPFTMIEGMVIAGIATDSHNGVIYVRAEYPLAVRRLYHSIDMATKYGLLGDNILGTDFSFHLEIIQGAGAFVCGEGSAMIESIQGDRGLPRVKPPRTYEKGLFLKPTVLNNVETFANVPHIITRGVDWYTSMGPENNHGTKCFALTGNIARTGLIEVPLGTPLKHVIYDIGGGIKDGKTFKAVQIGGPSGACLTSEHMDVALDFDSIKKAQAMVGSGGLVVMDDESCMIEVARFFMNFTQSESCGKCVPCRIGTKRMLEILERIVAGKGEMEDIDKLQTLASNVRASALCGLGKTAPNPILSTLRLFKDEYIAHIQDKKCPAGQCAALKTYVIDPDKCKGCSLCAKKCPADAISGVVKKPFVIDAVKCIKCGSCIESCKFGAISVQ